MFLPLRTDCPLRHTPYMNWALIAVNFIVFFVQIAHNPQAPDDSAFTRPLILDPMRPHLWQYVTAAFLHGGWLHIIGNMLFLYIFGNNVNDRMGNLGYLGFYLAGAVFSGVGYVALDGRTSVLGASGAVSAVTGAFLVLFPRTNILVAYIFYFIGTVEIASIWVILFFFSKDLFAQFIVPALSGGRDDVAHMAHISGTFFGIALCFIFLLVQLLPRDQFDVLALVQRWNRRRQYRDMVSKGYDPFGVGPPPSARSGFRRSPPPPDPRRDQVMALRAQIAEAVTVHDMARAVAAYAELMTIDPEQVLSRTTLLDVANYFASQQHYPQAAAAYEQFQKHYGNYEQIEQVHLMMGVIYGRYLHQYELAKQYLLRALARLYTSRDVELAKSELAQVETHLAAGGPTI